MSPRSGETPRARAGAGENTKSAVEKARESGWLKLFQPFEPKDVANLIGKSNSQALRTGLEVGAF